MHAWWRWALVFLACWVMSPGLRTQAQTASELKEQAAQKEVDRQELENIERETGRAVQLHNGTFFRRVYSDDFIGTLSGGQALDKRSFVTALENSGVEYLSFVVTDIRVRLYEDTAVVTASWSWRRSDRGATISRQARVLHVYVNGPRGWQAVASQETILPG